MKDAKLKTGNIKAQVNEDGIRVKKYKGKKDVLMLSTFHGSDFKDTGKRCRDETVTKPTVIINYNRVKGGIDLSDQLISYYSPARKSVKWFQKVLFQCISIAKLNSFVLYNKCYAGHGMRTMKLEAFTKALASSLLQPKSEPEMFPRHQHELSKIQRKADNKIVRKRCHGCYKKIAVESGRKQALAKTKQDDIECVSCKNLSVCSASMQNIQTKLFVYLIDNSNKL